MKDDAVYLRHILECIWRIEENIAGGRAQFMKSHTFQESANAGRVHPASFSGIDLESIWDIIQRDVPPLKCAIVAMLEREA
jgi:uncharacterized protein with HEPN domain